MKKFFSEWEDVVEAKKVCNNQNEEKRRQIRRINDEDIKNKKTRKPNYLFALRLPRGEREDFLLFVLNGVPACCFSSTLRRRAWMAARRE